MSQFGDSLLVINDEEIVKVDVHTEYPGKVFNYGQQYGELIKLKVENMREQHREVIRKEQHTAKPKMETVETAIITISMGEGISEIFKSMGATHIISGGQTMILLQKISLKSLNNQNVNVQLFYRIIKIF